MSKAAEQDCDEKALIDEQISGAYFLTKGVTKF